MRISGSDGTQMRTQTRLSNASVYEQMFGTVHRGVGRPMGDVEPLFASAADLKSYDAGVVSAAKRRAYAVVHAEQRVRLREVFVRELKVLARRNRSNGSRVSGSGSENGQ